MTQQLYVVLDKVADQVSGVVWQMPNDAAAMRMFSQVVKTPDSALARSPLDYALARVGSVDVTTGLISSEEVPVIVITGEQVVGSQDGPRG